MTYSLTFYWSLLALNSGRTAFLCVFVIHAMVISGEATSAFLPAGLWRTTSGSGGFPMSDVLKRLSFLEQLTTHGSCLPIGFHFQLYPMRSSKCCVGSDNPRLQRAMRGNVCSYEMDAPGISDMVQGNLMPRRPAILTSIIQVTLSGQHLLPEHWLRNLFRVRRRLALTWLKENNPKFYGNIDKSSARLQSLPEDGVPSEIMAITRHVDGLEIVRAQDDSYVPNEDDEIGELTSTLIIPMFDRVLETDTFESESSTDNGCSSFEDQSPDACMS